MARPAKQIARETSSMPDLPAVDRGGLDAGWRARRAQLVANRSLSMAGLKDRRGFIDRDRLDRSERQRR
jgi:hypothetical protein